MGKKRAMGVASLANETSKDKISNGKLKTQKKRLHYETNRNSHEDSIAEKKKPGHEIEEIFSTLKKRKKPGQGQSGEVAEAASMKQKLKKKEKAKQLSAKESGFVDPPKPRRRTEDGFTIYNAEELGIGKSDAGGTPLCPFDCDCCF